MADRDEIVRFCDGLLDAAGYEDYCPNGLQVPGAAEVETIVTGVSAQLELFERARQEGAQMVLTHHGIFWNSQPRALTIQMRDRLARLLAGDISLVAYHLPLDAHPEIGNNALLRDGLRLEDAGERIAVVKGRPIGVVAKSPEPIALARLVERVESLVGQKSLTFDSGPGEVRTVGIVSGAGSSSIHEAVSLGLDALLTGEPSEHVMADAREGGVNFIAAGHYATETLGVRRLGAMLAERFGIRHVFCDLPNPI